MTAASEDEELHQPRRRVPGGVLLALAGVAVVGVVLVAVNSADRSTPSPRPSTQSSTTTPPPPSPSPRFEQVLVGPPDALIRAVTAAYPRARLVEMSLTVPDRPDPDRSYQFLLGARRITVVIGPADARPPVETASSRDVLVVAKPAGHRVAVTVRAFRGTLRPTELGTVRRLAQDARLLATP